MSKLSKRGKLIDTKKAGSDSKQVKHKIFEKKDKHELSERQN